MNKLNKLKPVFLLKSAEKIIDKEKTKDILWSILRGLIIIGISYIILYPLLTKISSSLMAERDLFDHTVRWIPRSLNLENYRLVFRAMDYPRAIYNTLRTAVLVTVIQLISCSLIGYGFARFDFRGNKFLFALVIFTLVVPPQMIMIPLYLNFRFFDLFGILPEGGLNLLGTYWPFIFLSLTGMGMRNGLFIYIFRQFFKGMPVELEEAAYVDGAGPITTFIKIMVPGALPAFLVVFLFSFVWQWNDNFYIHMFLPYQHNLPTALSTVANDVSTLLGERNIQMTGGRIALTNNTGMLFYIAPLLLLYSFTQRYFIESVQRTGIVG